MVLLLVPFFRSRAEKPLVVKRFSIEQGLSAPNVKTCLKDRNGFLWLATNDGLNRFDGRHFKVYRNNPADTNSLIGNTIVGLGEDRFGNLWILTTKGLCQYSIAENRFKRFHFPWMSSLKKLYSMEPAFFIDGDQVWFSDYDGINCLHAKRNAVKQYFLEKPYKGRLIKSIGKDARGRMYAGTIEGTFRFDREANVFKRLPLPEPTAAGLSIFNDSRKALWFTRWATGATLFETETGKSTQIGGQETLFQLFEIQPDSFWACGDYTGLLTFSRRDPVLRPLSLVNRETGNREAFSINSIQAFGDGYLWMCSEKGLVQYDFKAKPFSSLSSKMLGFSAPGYFTGVAIDPQDKEKLWVNVWYQNLNVFNLKTNRIDSVFNAKKVASNNLPWVNSYGIYHFENELWFCGFHGIWRKENGSNMFSRLLPASKKVSFLHFPCNKLLRLKNGHFLVVVRGKGLVEFSKDLRFYQETPFQFRDLFDWDLAFNSLLELDNSTYLLSSEKSGLVRFSKTSGLFERISSDRKGKTLLNYMQGMVKDGEGNIWIGSSEGIVTLDKNLQIIHEFSAQNGLPGSLVNHILADKSGNIWIATSGGLALWEPESKTFRNFSSSEGLPDNHPEHLFLLQNGQLVTGHQSGLGFFEAEKFDLKPKPPTVVISDVFLENQQIAFQEKPNLEVSPDIGQIEVWFSALEYGKPEGMQYAYQVEGLHDQWISLGEKHQISFFQLPPGEYTLRVKAISAFGVSSLKPAELVFTILTPYYKTWWFRLLLVGLVVGAVVAFYRYRIRQLLKLEKVRMRISRDLHDDIGSTLSSINMLTRSAKRRFEEKDSHRLSENLNKIGERTQEILENMSDIIWSVKPENDSLDRVASRMREFAAGILEAKKINFIIRFDPDLEKFNLPLEVKNNMFMIFKEAVNNMAKYSQCTLAEIEMKVEGRKLMLKISDNGIGFDLLNKAEGARSGNASGGNGLRNMHQRAVEVGGNFEMVSKPGQGTQVLVEMPM